jgi:hypothetical protein
MAGCGDGVVQWPLGWGYADVASGPFRKKKAKMPFCFILKNESDFSIRDTDLIGVVSQAPRSTT